MVLLGMLDEGRVGLYQKLKTRGVNSCEGEVVICRGNSRMGGSLFSSIVEVVCKDFMEASSEGKKLGLHGLHQSHDLGSNFLHTKDVGQ